MWYGGGTSTGTGGWSRAGTRKQSVAESDAPPPGGGGNKPASGRVIRIINNMDHSIQVMLIFEVNNIWLTFLALNAISTNFIIGNETEKL